MTSPLRSSLLLAALASALAVAAGAAYGVHDGWVTLVMLLGVGAPGLVAAHVAATRRERLGSLRRQLAMAVTIGAGAVALALGVAVRLMFVSAHDAFFAALEGPVAEGGDELAGLARAADATIARLTASERARRELVAAVSHDLRTPITTLRLLAEAVDDDVVDAPTRERYVGQMHGQVTALAALIDDLFELSRLEAGELSWTMQRVELGDLVGETVEAMLVHGAAKGVALRAEVGPAVCAAQANPEKLQRVLFNLIQNAIRHTPRDGAVIVLAEARDGAVEVEVADTGVGIADDERALVFDPFFRGGAEAARTRTGAGLGLAISRAIVEAHGGRIWLVDGPVGGTRVRFSLPAAATTAALA